jgi:hypothetical protein
VNEKCWARIALSHPAFSGVPTSVIDSLIGELLDPWQSQVEGERHIRRGRHRVRGAGAGRRHELVFRDRVLVTVVAVRLRIPHACLASMFEVDRSTITRVIQQMRPLLIAHGFETIEGPRLRTAEQIFAYAADHQVPLPD